jgi:hypothetical protein
MYREIFSKHFPSPAAASTVPHVSIFHATRLNIEIPKKGIVFSTCQLGEMQVDRTFPRLDHFSCRAVCPPHDDAHTVFVLSWG